MLWHNFCDRMLRELATRDFLKIILLHDNALFLEYTVMMILACGVQIENFIVQTLLYITKITCQLQMNWTYITNGIFGIFTLDGVQFSILVFIEEL